MENILTFICKRSDSLIEDLNKVRINRITKLIVEKKVKLTNDI